MTVATRRLRVLQPASESLCVRHLLDAAKACRPSLGDKRVATVDIEDRWLCRVRHERLKQYHSFKANVYEKGSKLRFLTWLSLFYEGSRCVIYK